MFRFILICFLATGSMAMPYGSSMMFGGHGGYGGYDHGGYAVPAAVLSHHNVKYYEVPSHGYVKPISVDVPPNIIPVHFVFRSASSHVQVQQHHIPGKGDYQESYSKDEPHILKHTVTKPIIQEVHEVISPYRKIMQTIEPVKEEIQTMVARGTHGYGGHEMGGSLGGYGHMGGALGGYGHMGGDDGVHYAVAKY